MKSIKFPKVLYRVTGAEREALKRQWTDIQQRGADYRAAVAFIAQREGLNNCIFDEATASFTAAPPPPVNPPGAKPTGG